jgi:hypothetical protein
MRTRAARLISLPALLGVCLLVYACGRPSTEARIREVLKESAAKAEKRDLAGFMEFLADDYSDGAGRDKEATARLVAGHLDRFRGIVIHVLGARVGEPGPDGRIGVDFEVVLSHGAAEVLRKLIRVTGEYYRFEAELRQDARGAWRYTYAAWEPLGLADLFPESLAVLKELFPEL